MLIFNLRTATLSRVDKLTTATNSTSYPTVRVNKYDDWPGKTIIARFVGGEDGDVYDVTVQNDICTVPAEIMTQKEFFISFKGVSGSTIITTNQVKIKNAYSGFDLDAEEPATPTPDLITQLINSVAALRSMVGSPLVASTAAGMTDTSKIYVYTGSETGYTAGNWYYYDGAAWQSGGVYNSTAVNTDTTLSVSGAAADSKTVGDSIGDLTQLNTTDKTSLVGAINEVVSSGSQGDGLTNDIKEALLDCFAHVAWIDEDGQDYYDALHDALYPPIHATAITLSSNSLSFATLNSTQTLTATVTPSDTTDTVTWASSNTSVATVNNGVVTSVAYGSATITATCGSVSATCSVTIAQATVTSISAVYTQSGTVYDIDSLDSLKSDLVVTASWSNSTTSTVASADYTLSGTLTVGTSTITVSYGGKTTTFNVTVSAETIMIDGYNASNTSTASTCGPYALYYNNVYTYDHTKQLTSIELNVITAGKMSILIAPLSSISDNKVTTWDNVIVKDTLYIESTGFQKVYLNERFVIPDGYILVIGGGTSSSGILDEPDTCLWKYGNYGSQKGFCWINANIAKSLGINVYVGG